MKCRQRRRIKPLDILLAAICAVSLTAAALIGWTIFHQDAVYRELSIDAEADAGDGIDWDGLRARNPDIAAWVSVEGTPVDFPVVSPREGDPKGFYLNHDFDRNWSFSGCPYLDPRCGADGRHALVYGHHLNFDGEMFTYLRDAWRQEKFDALGDMRWSTPAEGTVSLHPAFSMSVDKSFADIQRFDFNGTAELRAWLSALSAQATAKADGCDALCAGAKRVGASWNYVCLLVDLYNREIVGHSAGPRKDARLVKSAFATLSFPISDIEVFHTDRGSEFDNAEIDLMLEAFGIERSLSAKGCPYDNAVDESTNRILKAELVHRETFGTTRELRAKLSDYVHWYNNFRIHSTLGYMSPVEFREAGLSLPESSK